MPDAGARTLTLSGRLERRVALFLGAVVALISLSVGTANVLDTRRLLVSAFLVSAETTTRILAEQVGGGVQFRRAPGIAAVVNPVLDRAESGLALLAAYDSGNQEIVRFGAEGPAQRDLADALPRSNSFRDADRRGADIVTTKDHAVVIMPVVLAKDGRRVGTIATVWSFEGLSRDVTAAAWRNGLLTTVSILLLIAGLFVALRLGLTRPLVAAIASMRAVAAGDLDRPVVGLARRDELGDMARALHVLRDGLKLAEQERQAAATTRLQAEAERQSQLERLAGDFERAMSGVVETIGQSAEGLRQRAQSLDGAMQESGRQSTEIAAAGSEASGNADSVAAAAGQLTASIAEITRRVEQNLALARVSVDHVEQSNETVEGLALAADRINLAIDLISRIASQTNLLALNATIEAARAGTAGKGFAVVANEVKSLAAQTSGATADIARLVRDIQAVADGAARSITTVGENIRRMNELSAAVAAAVEQQSMATQDISTAIGHVVSSTRGVGIHIEAINRSEAQARGIAATVLSDAESFVAEADHLRRSVAGFVAQVRRG